MATANLPAAQHVVVAAQLRAQIAVGEAHRNGALTGYLPELVAGFDALPDRVAALIAAGHNRSAEYWLIQAERHAGVISGNDLQSRITALGKFHLQSHLDGCRCEPGTCLT